jgi:hypothetical protein
LQEIKGTLSDHGGLVAVPGKLHMYRPLIMNFYQRAKDLPEIDFSLAEEQMFMLVLPHIF